MEGIINKIVNFNNFFYFMFWGFLFSAGYFVYKKIIPYKVSF